MIPAAWRSDWIAASAFGSEPPRFCEPWLETIVAPRPNRWCSASSTAAPRLSICSGRLPCSNTLCQTPRGERRRTAGRSRAPRPRRSPGRRALPAGPAVSRRARPRAGGGAPDRAWPRSRARARRVPAGFARRRGRRSPRQSAPRAEVEPGQDDRPDRAGATTGEAERCGQPGRRRLEARQRDRHQGDHPAPRRRASSTRSGARTPRPRGCRSRGRRRREATPADTRAGCRGTAPLRRRSVPRSAGRAACP